jgi:hypothetical protein
MPDSTGHAPLALPRRPSRRHLTDYSGPNRNVHRRGAGDRHTLISSGSSKIQQQFLPAIGKKEPKKPTPTAPLR